jgi:hypothetical protein
VRWRGYKKWEIGIFFPSLLLLSILDFLVELDLSFLKAFACVTLNPRSPFYYITTAGCKDARNTCVASQHRYPLYPLLKTEPDLRSPPAPYRRTRNHGCRPCRSPCRSRTRTRTTVADYTVPITEKMAPPKQKEPERSTNLGPEPPAASGSGDDIRRGTRLITF